MPRVLCVDDDESIRLLVKALLTNMLPADVTIVGSGEEALIWLLANPPPDLILLDLMMPGINGYETHRRICGLEGPTPRVAFLSAQGTHNTETHPEAALVPLIEKPFGARAFVDRVRALLAGDGAARE